MSENESERNSPVPAWIGIILAATWVGVGAVFKLMEAGPNDLPPLFTDQVDAWFNWTNIEAYRWAVTIEIVIVATALLRPRLGWILLALQYVAFLVILINLQLSGAESCGCFGGVVRVEPHEMMLVDAPLLLILLFTKPWKRLPKRVFSPLPWVAIALVGVGALWAPHHFMKTNMDTGRWWAFWETFEEGNGTSRVAQPHPSGEDPNGTGPEDPNNSGNPPTPVQDEVFTFIDLNPNEWVNESLETTVLGEYLSVDPYEVPDTAHVILYRRSCDHCAQHLEQLAINPITDRPVVMIELRADGDEALENLILLEPEGVMKYDMKSLPQGYGMQTPWSLELEGWVITSVEDTRANMDG